VELKGIWKRQLSSCLFSFYFIFIFKTFGYRGDFGY
jgi:hypothetical protein